MNQLEEAALRYADNGWHVFPLYGIVDSRCECGTNCGSPGKHPRISNGLHGATTDEGKIKSWWKRWPSANVGIATGAVSGIYVVDVDNKRSVDLGSGILIGEGENSLRQQSQAIGGLPETRTSITGSGGTHLIFSYPIQNTEGYPPESSQESVTFGNRTGILPSVDTRGNGGYIVAPPQPAPEREPVSVDGRGSTSRITPAELETMATGTWDEAICTLSRFRNTEWVRRRGGREK